MNIPQTNAGVFFHLDADYHVASEAAARELLEDAHCLLGCAVATLNVTAIELSNGDSDLSANPHTAASVLFGVYHTMHMVQGAIAAALAQVGARAGND